MGPNNTVMGRSPVSVYLMDMELVAVSRKTNGRTKRTYDLAFCLVKMGSFLVNISLS